MNPVALVLILAAAFLHATWNVMLKQSGDPLLVAARAVGSSALIATPLAALAWTLSGRPALPPHAWLLAALSGLAELAYLIFLSEGYRRGDISVVYPIARGSAPLLAVLGGLLILHEQLGAAQVGGVVCLLIGIWSVRRPRGAGAATVPALLTGVCIATYSVIDAAGVHLAPPWLYGWAMWSIQALLLAGWVWLAQHQPIPWTSGLATTSGAVVLAAGSGRAALSGEAPDWQRGITIGILMLAVYLMVLIALRLAPLTIVSPLRESAIVLVTGWGVWRLQERQGMWLRLAGAVAILAGAILLTVAA